MAGRAPRAANSLGRTCRQRARPELAADAGVPPTRAQITLLSGPQAGRAHPLPNGITLLGRGDDAQVRVDDPGVSCAHARITRFDGGRYLLEDLASTNGTFVGERRIQTVDLSSGDRIHLGASTLLSFAVLDAQAERLARELYESSVRDPLTGAYNRRHLGERLQSEIAYAQRHATPLAAMLLDVDHFKRINDGHGHPVGDRVLQAIAGHVSRAIRKEDVFARFGGEEFVVLARGIDPDGVARCAERLRATIDGTPLAGLNVTVSIGYASLDEVAGGASTAEQLIQLADQRLYRAKAAGRNCVCGSGASARRPDRGSLRVG